MLRYWGSERTLWLHDVFGSPAPLAPLTFSNRFDMNHEIDESQVEDRRAEDRQVLNALLGRQEWGGSVSIDAVRVGPSHLADLPIS